MDSRSADGVGQATHNTVSGDAVIHGNLVQAQRIEAINIAAPEPLIPRQVPTPRRGFVNRTVELARLTAAVASYDEDSPPGVVVVTGMGGVGKTELVSEWVRSSVKDRFPGGQLYVDLSEARRDGGVDVGGVLGVFLRALGVDRDFIPAGLADRAGLFRSATAARRVLVVVDNAQHAAEVHPILPGNGLTVVLSRKRLAALEMDGPPVTVDPLEVEAGVELVSRWRGAAKDREAVVRLVKICGGLPLALRAAGERLIEHSRLSVEAVVRDLADGQRRRFGDSDPTAPVLDAVVETFPRHTRRLYAFLGCFPGTTFTAALAAAAGVERFDEGLDDLITVNLAVGVQHAADGVRPELERFRLHDVVSTHARTLARAEPEEDRAAVRRRVTDFYLVAVARADHLIIGSRFRLQEDPDPQAQPALSRDPLFTTGAQALEWLDAERANVLDVLRAAAEEGWHDVVWRLCESLWALYHSRKHYADWIEAQCLGIEAARAEGRIDVEVRMLNQLARAHYELGEYALADEQLTRADELLGSVADPQVSGIVWETRGLLCLARGVPDEAITLFTRALEANEGDPHGILVQSYNVGQALVAAGRPREALDLLADAMAAGMAERDPMRVRIGIVRGRAHQALGAFDLALEAVTDAAVLAKELRLTAKLDQALGIAVELADRIQDSHLRLVCRRKVRQLRLLVGVETAPAD